jgi:chromosome segregation ATPase
MSTTPTSSTSKGAQVTGAGQQRGPRLRNFLLPDGREVHISPTPEEAEVLRKRLEAINKDQPFDLVINGSPEHVDALRRAHSHHEQRRQWLRDRHGKAYEEFENVHTELDALGSELNALTEQNMSLSANFSKYGYSAHLRTYNDDDSPSLSRKSSMASGDPEKKDWEEERRNGRVIKIYSKVSTGCG